MKANENGRRPRRAGIGVGALILSVTVFGMASGQHIDPLDRRLPPVKPVSPALTSEVGNELLLSPADVTSVVTPASNGVVRADVPSQLGGAEGGTRAAVGTSFTYQGQLKDNGVPTNGTFDMRFTLLDDALATVAGPICREPVQVTDGLFTVELDFATANLFSGENRHLKIEVRPDNIAGNCAGGAYTLLNPPQKLSATPYAQGLVLPYEGIAYQDEFLKSVAHIRNTYGSALASAIHGTHGTEHAPSRYPTAGAGVYGESNTGSGVAGFTDSYIGVFGAALETSGTNIGGLMATYSPDGVGVFGRTGGGFISDYVPNSGVSGYSAVGQGVAGVTVDSKGVYGKATSGSGTNYGVYGVTDSPDGHGVYGLGVAVDIADDGGAAVFGENIAAGTSASLGAAQFGLNASCSAPGGAAVHGTATNDALWGVAGESTNTGSSSWGVFGVSTSTTGRGVYGWAPADSGANYGVFGESDSPSGYGGYFRGRGYFSGNVGIGTTSPSSLLHLNSADARIRLEDDDDPSSYTEFDATGAIQFVLRQLSMVGESNIDMEPSPQDGAGLARVRLFRSTNTTGSKSLELCRGNNTANISARISVDGVDSYFQNHGGNLGIGTSTPTARTHIRGSESTLNGKTAAMSLSNSAAGGGNWHLRAGATGTATPAGGFSIANDTFYCLNINSTGNVGIGVTNILHPLHMLSGAHCTAGGIWTNASDRNLKENFRPTDAKGVLDKVARMPIQAWNYKNEGKSIQHIGPTAQDFKAAFDLGGDDKSIGTIDADGVALVAIQGLNELIEEKDRQIAGLNERLAQLERAVSGLTCRE